MEKRRDVTQTEEGREFGSLLGVVSSLIPSKYDRCPAKSASKSLLEMLQNTNICYRNFCVYTENFQQSIMI
jgi:hypothetical protein